MIAKNKKDKKDKKDILLSCTQQKDIIIYGDNWPVICAVKNMAEKIQPSNRFHSCHSVPALAHLLQYTSDVRFIFCLRPREHIFLFHLFSSILSGTPLLVITDTLLPTDRVALGTFCVKPLIVYYDDIHSLFTFRHKFSHEKLQQDNPLFSSLTALTRQEPKASVSCLPLVFQNGSDLISFMNIQLDQYFYQVGITRLQIQLLKKMLTESTLKELATALDINIKTVTYNKGILFKKLGVKGGYFMAIYGAKFYLKLQKTPFIKAPNIENISEEILITNDQ